MKISNVEGILVSHTFKRRPNPQSRGSAIKRDVVLVRVTSDEGVVGYGETYHGHAGSALAELINTSIRDAVLEQSVHDVEGIRDRISVRFLKGAGLGAAVNHAFSGVDMALWDLRGKALGLPVYKLLGGDRRTFRAYAGGLSLGFQEPTELEQEVHRLREAHGYTAVKLRLGDNVERDLARVQHIRSVFGDDFEIMTDANLGYAYPDLYRLLPGLAECNVSWLEEPMPKDDPDAYADLRARAGVPIAAGENLYGRHEFKPWFEKRALDVIQPDCSKSGGITELKKLGDMAEMLRLRFAPHTSHSRLNHAATLHVMSAVPSSYIFEADGTNNNLFSQELITADLDIVDGVIQAPDLPGLGVTVHEDRLKDFPGIPGSPYPDQPRK